MAIYCQTSNVYLWDMPNRLTKVLIISGVFLLLTSQTFAQNFVLPDGEYMDTISIQNEKCPKIYNYFYSVGGKYPKNSASLLKEVQIFLQQKNKNYVNSGYITFRFMIDCEGKLLPKIQVLQTDEKYAAFHFEKDLVNELFAFLKTLDKWRMAKSKEGNTYSYKAFLTFKIKNGKVINIIP
jgi:hypothetical protein